MYDPAWREKKFDEKFGGYDGAVKMVVEHTCRNEPDQSGWYVTVKGIRFKSSSGKMLWEKKSAAKNAVHNCFGHSIPKSYIKRMFEDGTIVFHKVN